jgi:AcrR family transcriptional regulator
MPKAERRLQLLAVAREIIERDGIGALTMSAIAERSGASKPVVYEHFENSEAVALAILEDYAQGLIEYVTDRVQHAQTIDQYMNTVIDAMFDYNVQTKLIVRKITNGFSSTDLVNEYYLKRQRKSVDVVRNLLEQQGVARNISGVAAYALLEMMTNTVLEFSMKTNNSIARDTLKRMVSSTIHSLMSEPGSRPRTPSSVLRSLKR